MTFSLSSAATNTTNKTELSSPLKGGTTKADSSLVSAALDAENQPATGLFAQFFAQFSDGNKDPATRSAAASDREQDATSMLTDPDEISAGSAASLAKSADALTTETLTDTAFTETAVTETAVIETVLNANGSQANASSLHTNPLTAGKLADNSSQTAGANTESNDALLARLGQSAMLLQTPTQGSADRDLASAPAMTDNALADMALSDNGGNNGEANSDLVAGTNSWDLAATPTILQPDDITAPSAVALPASMTMTAVPAAVAAGLSERQGEQSVTAEAGADTPGQVGSRLSYAQQLAGQTSDGQGGPATTGNNQTASSANDNRFYTELSGAEQQETAATEKVETLDFNQIMESARKSEALELSPRIPVRTQPLSEAEQQLLDKRVNLHNTSASSELHEKISLMAGKDLHTATIRLDPAELGSLHIKLVLQNDQVNVTIQAQNGQSRDLLEQQLPRLREMLQQQGINLGDSQVQSDSSSQQQSAFQQHGQERQQAGMNSSQSAGTGNGAETSLSSAPETAVSSQYWQDSGKGVDFYA